MHRLLQRQIIRIFGSLDKLPSGLEKLLEIISSTYDSFDEDKALIDRSMEISSRELSESNQKYRALFANMLSGVAYNRMIFDESGKPIDYIFLENSDMSLSSKADLTTGARERHGDRVIAVGLCVLGMKDQMEGNVGNIKEPPKNSFEYRFREWQAEQEKEKRKKRQFLF